MNKHKTKMVKNWVYVQVGFKRNYKRKIVQHKALADVSYITNKYYIWMYYNMFVKDQFNIKFMKIQSGTVLSTSYIWK